MAYKELTGNIFATKCQALGNTVNCVGDMGKGIALSSEEDFLQWKPNTKSFVIITFCTEQFYLTEKISLGFSILQ